MTEERRTVCNRDCPDACGLVATVDAGRVIRLTGDKANPVTHGFLCHRTSHFLARQYSRERLRAPLVRRDGVLQETTWEDALDHVAERLLAIRGESGPASIFHYRSGGSLGHLKALCDLFFERFGPVTVKRGDICSGAGEAAQELDFGGCDSNHLDDLQNARSIVLWGKNPAVSSPHTLPVLREAKKRGARLMLIDPVDHRMTRECSTVIRPRPGGDLALALAVGQHLFETGGVHPDAGNWCDNVDAFEALCRTSTIDAFCEEADVTREDVAAIADALHQRHAPATILVGWGMARRHQGGAIVRALDALGAITGNIGVPGAGVSFYFNRHSPFDKSFIGGLETAPRSIREPLFARDVRAAKDPPVRAIWITAGNPVAMLPESQAIADVLDETELVVVVDSFLTDTAQHADVVLPTTTLLEDDDILGGYGNHMIGASTPVVPAPDGVKSDLEILQALAARVGLEGVLDGDARHWKERLLSDRAKRAGLTVEGLEEKPVHNPLAPAVVFEGRVFKTANQKARLLDARPPRLEEAPNAAYPLFLMALSHPKSQSAQWVEAPDGPIPCTVGVGAAGAFADGDIVRLVTEIGAIHVRLVVDPRQRDDVALLPKGGHFHRGQAANAITEARLTDLGEGGALYDQRARLEAIAAAT